MKKVWPEFCPFRTYLRVQNNISDTFERFSITTKNEDAGNLQEKFWLCECAKCDKRFPYHYSFKDLSNMYLSDEWKKSGLNSVPSEPIWGYNIISLTSLKGFLSVHATKKWRRRNPSRQILAIWMCDVWQTISLSLLF